MASWSWQLAMVSWPLGVNGAIILVSAPLVASVEIPLLLPGRLHSQLCALHVPLSFRHPSSSLFLLPSPSPFSFLGSSSEMTYNTHTHTHPIANLFYLYSSSFFFSSIVVPLTWPRDVATVINASQLPGTQIGILWLRGLCLIIMLGMDYKSFFPRPF